MPYYSSYRRRSYRPRRRTPVRRRSYAAAPVRRRTTTRRRKTYTRSVPSTCSCKNEISPAQKFLIAQADPFHPLAAGAKIPDSSTIPSLSICDVENIQLNLGATTDSKCLAFLPTYNNSVVSSTGGVGAWAWSAAYGGVTARGKTASYNTNFELDRPVAHAIRLSSPVAPTSATGFVHIAIAHESQYNVGTWQWPTNTAGLSAYQYYTRVTLASLTQSPLTVINKFTDETAFRYAAANTGASANVLATSNEFNVFRSWGAILVAVEGSSSIAPLQFEHLLLTEATPSVGGSVSGSTAAASQPAVMAAAGHMSASVPMAHTEDQQETYIQQAVNAAAEGLSSAGDEAFQNVIMPIAQGLGYQAGRAAVAGIGVLARGIGGVNNNPLRIAG